MLGKDEIKRIDPNEHVCVIIWSVPDVLEQAKERGIKISKKEAEEILDRMENKHDATIGINWDTIDSYLGELDDERHEEEKEKKKTEKVAFT
jgi:hypothetical protein